MLNKINVDCPIDMDHASWNEQILAIDIIIIVPLSAVSRRNDLSKSRLKREVCDLIGETKNRKSLLCSCLDASTKLLVGLMANFLYALVMPVWDQPNIKIK